MHPVRLALVRRDQAAKAVHVVLHNTWAVFILLIFVNIVYCPVMN